ncbi:[protein-PII] uridylyltransferase [Oleispirillum naphthae]|uniref:[protein-PII] uridylyltransferase n=1 Tax=Oleispirillum naphthae TaxID=2838853 RepID=UPI00308253DF
MDTKTMQSVAMACDWDADQARLGCSGIAPEFLAAIPDPEQIIRCDAMVARLEEIWQEAGGDAAKARPAALALFKAALKDGSEEIRRRFEDDKANGTQVVRAQAYLVDRIVHALMELVVKRIYGEGVRTTGEALTVAAVGGYGRGELAPHSDIDLLFLLPYKATAYHEKVVETVLYMLWDLGLKVGHSTRSPDECVRQAKDDSTVKTALLECRWLWGDKALYDEARRRYWEDVVSGTSAAFIEQKLAERDERHQRTGCSRYVLEPNIKEGKGGLRDLHTLFWIAKYTYGVTAVEDLVKGGLLTPEAVRVFTRAQNFLWTVRCHMHYLTGRAEDRLTFDLQPELARRMGYKKRTGQKTVERFMKHYFLVAKDVGDLTRMVCAVLEEQNKRRTRFGIGFARRKVTPEGFVIEKNRVDIVSDDVFAKDPVNILRLFFLAHDQGHNIHPHALKRVTEELGRVKGLRRDAEANRLFLDILTHRKNPESTLRKMNESGVFARFVPDFGRVVAQMQYDMYHVYTTDEHTIRTVGILHDIELGRYAADMPTATELFPLVQSRRALYVAMLLHDIAKGSGEDHSVAGARIALTLGPRFGLSEEETETVSWLVRNHLIMSMVAFKRDLDDPKTIADFAAQVQSPERLRQLHVLTCADIRGVGPDIWNAWKAQLLRALYSRTLDRITGGLASSAGVSAAAEQEAAAKDALRARLADWPAELVDRAIERGYRAYWYSFTAEEHERQARIMRAADEAGEDLTVVCRVNPDTAHTEVMVYTTDHPGLFSKIAGAMVLASASILDARITTFSDGMAMDVFTVQGLDGEAYTEIDRIERAISRVLKGEVRIHKELAERPIRGLKRTQVFTVPPRVIIDNTASAAYTLIEINGRDRPGLLYDVTSALRDLGLQINSAHISTYGERVVDVFYVKDVFGMKIAHEGKLQQVRRGLLDAIEPFAPAAGAKSA